MSGMTVKELWGFLTLAEKEDACLAFLEGKDTFSRDALPRVTQELAGVLKFREAFLKRLPPREKARHLRRMADSPTLRHVCDDLLRSWVVSRKNPMLVCFVEAQGLKHTDGILDDSVTAPSLDSVKKGVRAVRDQFPPREVALYMGVMLTVGGDFWTGLAEAVDSEFPAMKASLAVVDHP
ncbi:MAG: hypothetical protein WCO42_05455 [bacterium]